MAKSVQTSFTLRVADKSKPVIVGDQQVASALSGANFYSITYTVDTVGTYLGEIREFLAVQCKDPVLIEFQRVDMEVPTQIYCDSLFLNHGDFGTVWLRIPYHAKPAIVTVWYSTDATVLALNESVTAFKAGLKNPKNLRLRNLDGKDLGLPLARYPNSFKTMNKIDGKLRAVIHNGEVRNLPIHSD
jgi:hypothetical protein